MDCIFCKIINGEIPCKKLYEDDLVIAILDVNPRSCGHTLVIPKKHYKDITELPDELLLHINKVSLKLADKIAEKLDTKSITFVINYLDNLVPHFHKHIIPGYNFEPNKDMKYTVDETFDILKEE